MVEIHFDHAGADINPPGSSGPGPNLGHDVSMSSQITNVKTTFGITRTGARRAMSTAPDASKETVLMGENSTNDGSNLSTSTNC